MFILPVIRELHRRCSRAEYAMSACGRMDRWSAVSDRKVSQSSEFDESIHINGLYTYGLRHVDRGRRGAVARRRRRVWPVGVTVCSSSIDGSTTTTTRRWRCAADLLWRYAGRQNRIRPRVRCFYPFPSLFHGDKAPQAAWPTARPAACSLYDPPWPAHARYSRWHGSRSNR